MDALSEILRIARLSSGIFLRGEFSEPFRLTSRLKASNCSPHLGPSDHLILFHFVLEGRLNVELENGGRAEFIAGEAVVLPRNDPHRLRGEGEATAVMAQDVLRIPGPGELMAIEHGGGGARTRIICGFLGGKGLGGDPLLSALPAMFKYDSTTPHSGAFVAATLDAADREVREGRAGSQAILARISELLFVEAVRHHLENLSDDSDGWLGALRDVSVSKALAVMYRAPHENWTVERLGEVVGASRSNLSTKFVRYLGHGPGECLTKVRMQLAARDLLLSRKNIAEIAERVGYGSEAAFSRAFKREQGMAPSAWRASSVQK